ncbi:MAG: prolipoprotein diacylglyceryl transferase [Alphaproteobacteria bacterium]|nr:prolipoprotein diacylglyceryl transferase [Alphaproteobacteria bacterium]
MRDVSAAIRESGRVHDRSADFTRSDITTPVLTLPVIAFPAIDPVALAVGPIAIRWYALAYIAGILAGWRIVLSHASRAGSAVSRADADDFMVWLTFGIVLGGRLGYVFFYQPAYYIEHPLEALYVWRGGMSFHGGLLGVVIALAAFARRRRIDLLALADAVACAVPIGLFFGRIANFINGELFGRPSDVPWAMVFPNGGPAPRHPSQLYEATLEGMILFALLTVLASQTELRARRGALTGLFLIGYAGARSIGELFREPDAYIGFLLAGTTMGQWLSLPLAIGGLILIGRARRPGARV